MKNSLESVIEKLHEDDYKKQKPSFWSYAAPSLMRAIQPFIAEKTQLYGLDNLYYDYEIHDEKKMIPGPFLWIGKHESRWDAVILPSIVSDLPGYPFPIKAAARNDPFKNKIIDNTLNRIFRSVILPIARTDKIEGLSEKKKEELQVKNVQKIATLVDGYKRGVNVGIMIEGTSKSDGDLTKNPFKHGPYNISRNSETKEPIVPIVPLGNTFDFLCGDKGFFRKTKMIPIIRIGSPFLYEPLPKEEFLSEEDWGKKDRDNFAREIRERFIDLNTFTLSQLAGEYLFRVSENNLNPTFSEEKLRRIVHSRIDMLSQDPHSEFDEKIVGYFDRERRFKQFYKNLHEQGYITKEKHLFKINRERLLQTPEGIEGSNEYNSEFKKTNILLYSVNRIKGISQVRSHVKAALEWSVR